MKLTSIIKMNIEENSEDEYSSIVDDDYLAVREDLEQYFNSTIRSEENNYVREPREFIYPGLNLLKRDNIEERVGCYETANINVCTYQINNSGEIPFLQFVLRKYDKNHELKSDLVTFPSFKCIREENLIDMCELIENVICATYRIGLDNFEYKGFINEANEFYVFYELKNNSINIHDLYRANDLWLVLIDEIINQKRVCNFPIDEKVSQFFSNYVGFSHLKDNKENYFETPTVAYVGSTSKQLNWISCFGVSKTIEDYFSVSYYYFTDYQNAIRMGGWSEDQLKRGGVVRFALFLGYTKVCIVDEGVDECNYDSIYIGNKEKSPLWALKEYKQQLPLTCHYIDKSTLGESWSKNGVYYIL